MILALFDFYKVSNDELYGNLVFKCSSELLKRQIDKPDDLYRHGRWKRSLTSSGNGWLNEVMSELYLYCREKGMDGCEKYKDAIIKVTRWALQYSCYDENAFLVKNPERARGGIFWNRGKRYVRTDSVCHGINAYVNILKYLDDGTIISIPERPLKELLTQK